MTDRSIVFVVNCLALGGAEIQVMRLADGLRKRGWQVSVVSLLQAGALEKPLREKDVPVYSLNMRPRLPNPAGIIRLRKILTQLKPDIVHSHIVHANLLTRLTRLLTRMPVLICTAHNVREGGRSLELGYRYTDSLSDLTTNVSQAAVDRYVQIGAAPINRIRVVPNGLDTSIYTHLPEDRARYRVEMNSGDQFVWLAVGRFQEQKDYPNMLRAFARTIQSPLGAHSRLIIAGNGPLEDACRQLAAAIGIASRVDFLGARLDVPALMNMADGFVLSSAWEGMPLVLQEAAASGLPIVATRVGGNAEVAIEGESALLVSPRDADALATAMNQLMALPPAARQAMGARGRAFVVQHFELDRVLDQWESIYTEMRLAKAGGMLVGSPR